MESNELTERYETAKYILDISYLQLERYDEKTNQLLTLTGIDFTVLGIFTAVFFQNMSAITVLFKILFLAFVLLDMILIIASLFVVKRTLSPHLKPVNNHPKTKRGMVFFSDIETSFEEEEYVDIMLGKKPVRSSNRYSVDDADAFNKCIIEDCAYDIYEQAKILSLKSKNIKTAYRIVVSATTMTLITVVLLSIIVFF